MTKPSAVHAIVGDRAFDSFLAEEALEALLAEAVGKERADAVEAFRGEEATWARVLDAARTRSLFATQRAVVVRDADALKGEPDGLDAFLGDPPPGVVLVLLAAKPDRRRTVWKKLLERAKVVKAEPLKGAALRGRLQDELRRRKLAIPGDAVEEVLERVGQDLRRLMGELDKLEDLVWVPNATTGLNAVIRSLRLEPEDEVLTTAHEYGAVLRAWEFVGARLVVAEPGDLVARIGPRTRVVFLSHVTSPTAIVLPVEEV